MSARQRWRRRLRDYGAAAMLNLALISPLPVPPLGAPAPIVRPVGRRFDGFDPREALGQGLVLTLPIEDGLPLDVDAPLLTLN